MLGAFALYPWFLASLYRAIRRTRGDDGMLAVVILIGGLACSALFCCTVQAPTGAISPVTAIEAVAGP